MAARRARAVIAALVMTVVTAAIAGCSDTDDRSAPTSVDAPSETLPPLPTIRVVTSDDLRTEVATEVVIGALSANGAVVERLEPIVDATAALRSGDADVAIVAAPPADLAMLATTDRLVVMDPFPGTAADGELVPVLTATVSQRFGDLLEAVITAAVTATDRPSLDVMVDRVAGDGDPIAEVVTDHLAELGLVGTSTTTVR